MNTGTEYANPPIPPGWTAIYEGHKPGDPLGRGPTHDAALLDLQQQADEYQREQIATAQSEASETANIKAYTK